MRTITIANQKGGCGKTTVAINLSASLAREARRVLLVDLDPQAHCAVGLAVPEEQIDLSMYDCLLGRMDGEPLELSRITWQIAPNLALAPSRSNLSTLEAKLGTREGADVLLRDLLQENASRYDYCVVDCPPQLGFLVRNGLCAADDILIPVDTGFFSLHGLTHQLATIAQLGERRCTKPSVRILANQYDVRTKLAREILAEVRKRYKDLMYKTIVNFNTKLKEGASFGQPITEFAPNSMGARDFQCLARELTESEPPRVPTPDIVEHIERLAADAERLLATTTTLVGNSAPTTTKTTTISRVTTASPSGAPAGPPPGDDDVSKHAETKPAPVVLIAGSPEAAGAPAVGRPDPADVSPIRAATLRPPTRPSSESAPAGTDTCPERAPQLPATSAQRDTALPPPAKWASNEEIDRKIEKIYGVRQEGDAVIFRSHSTDASEIQVAGDFNDWMPHATPMRRLPDGDFEARLKLPKGRYRYRLVVDGRWSHDYHNPIVETNEYGELNSVVEVIR